MLPKALIIASRMGIPQNGFLTFEMRPGGGAGRAGRGTKFALTLGGGGGIIILETKSDCAVKVQHINIMAYPKGEGER